MKQTMGKVLVLPIAQTMPSMPPQRTARDWGRKLTAVLEAGVTILIGLCTVICTVAFAAMVW